MPHHLELLADVSKGIESGQGYCRDQEDDGFLLGSRDTWWLVCGMEGGRLFWVDFMYVGVQPSGLSYPWRRHFCISIAHILLFNVYYEMEQISRTASQSCLSLPTAIEEQYPGPIDLTGHRPIEDMKSSST